MCPVPAQEACKLQDPQYWGGKTFSVITQTLTGMGRVFLITLNIH